MLTKMLEYNFEESCKRLTIQIVAPGVFIEPLKEALNIENAQRYKERLQFVFCEDVEDSCSRQNQFGVAPDYIAIVLDPTNKTCIESAEENMRKMDGVFVTGGRLCLVNGSCSVKHTDMGVGRGYINLLSQRLSVILINGDVLIPEKCLYLALRITELATSVCGFFTGIPVVVDIPGHDEDLG